MPNSRDTLYRVGYTCTVRAFSRRSSFHSPPSFTQTHVPERASDPQV
jgi:hypothetical protein